MITAIILTRNEQKNLDRCLQSLAFCEKIVLIDDFSTDTTASIAKARGAEVFERALQNDFASQRNAAFTLVESEWYLFVDADEVVSAELANEIKTAVSEAKLDCFYIPRIDHFWGKTIKHGEVNTAATKGFIRLVKKGSGNWIGKVHECFVPNGSTGKLSHALDHYPHTSITSFLMKINSYSTLRAKELQQQGKETNGFELLVQPLVKGLYTFFIKGGYKDGAAGFVYSFMMSFHSFLVRAKLYQYTKLQHETH